MVTYVTQDLVTSQQLGEFPLVQKTGLPRALNGDSDASFDLLLADESNRLKNPKQNTEPGRTALFAVEEGRVVWGGIIWSRFYNRKTRTLTLNVSTAESYFRHRFFNQRMEITDRDQNNIMVWIMSGIWPLAGFTGFLERQQSWALGPNYNTFTSLDPLDGFWIQDYDGKRIAVADNIDGFDFPIEEDPDAGLFNVTGWYVDSGIKRDRTYDAGKNVYDALVELSNVQGGPEWTMEPMILPADERHSDQRYGWRPLFGKPRLGRTVDVTTFRWEASALDEPVEGDNVQDYTFGDDARPGSNHHISTGAEVDGRVLVSDRGDLSSLRNGYPTLESSTAYSDVVFQGTLDSHSTGDLNQRSIPQRTTVWEVDADAQPNFGSYTLGDEAEFRASDDLDEQQDDGTPGRVSVERIVGWTYYPASSADMRRVELVTNDIVQASPRLPANLKNRYDRMDRETRNLSVVSRAPRSNVAVSATNTQPVTLPNSGTANVDGPVTVVTSFFFPKQADMLYAFFAIVSGTAGANWNWYDTRTGTAIPVAYSEVYKGSPTANGSVWQIRLDLAPWQYGELVEIEFRAYVQTSSTTATRTLRSWAAYQGPK